jgi:Mn-dependent DtxR family transcriptional regulator
MNEDKKEKIVNFLRENGESAIGKISSSLKINYYTTEEILSELKKTNVVDIVEKPRGNYWKLKEVKKK